MLAQPRPMSAQKRPIVGNEDENDGNNDGNPRKKQKSYFLYHATKLLEAIEDGYTDCPRGVLVEVAVHVSRLANLNYSHIFKQHCPPSPTPSPTPSLTSLPSLTPSPAPSSSHDESSTQPLPQSTTKRLESDGLIGGSKRFLRATQCSYANIDQRWQEYSRPAAVLDREQKYPRLALQAAFIASRDKNKKKDVDKDVFERLFCDLQYSRLFKREYCQTKYSNQINFIKEVFLEVSRDLHIDGKRVRELQQNVYRGNKYLQFAEIFLSLKPDSDSNSGSEGNSNASPDSGSNSGSNPGLDLGSGSVSGSDTNSETILDLEANAEVNSKASSDVKSEGYLWSCLVLAAFHWSQFRAIDSKDYSALAKTFQVQFETFLNDVNPVFCTLMSFDPTSKDPDQRWKAEAAETTKAADLLAQMSSKGSSNIQQSHHTPAFVSVQQHQSPDGQYIQQPQLQTPFISEQTQSSGDLYIDRSLHTSTFGPEETQPLGGNYINQRHHHTPTFGEPQFLGHQPFPSTGNDVTRIIGNSNDFTYFKSHVC
jgi:hypothetical protein